MKIKMNEKTDLCIESVFERFIKSCKVKNLAEETIEARRVAYKNFINYTDTIEKYNKNMINVFEIDKELVEDYTLYLKEELKLKVVTLNTYLRNMRVFLYWCMENHYCDNFKISLMKEPETMKETYTETDIIKLLKKPNVRKCEFSEYRNWVIVNFLFGTGIRKRTLINLKVEDIDLDNSLFKVKVSKSGAVSILPLPSTLIPILKEYFGFRKGKSDDYVFPNENGEKFNKNGLYNAIKRYNLRRGVDITSVHAFRHTFAKGIVKNHGDVFRLQKLMIHQDLQTTKKYVDLFSTDLEEGYSNYNPLDTFTKEHKKETINMKK